MDLATFALCKKMISSTDEEIKGVASGLTKTSQNADGSINVTYADGKTYTTPIVKGDKGDPGHTPTTEEMKAAIQPELDSKQPTLISGTNIKTINGQSVLGSGDIEVVSEDTLDEFTTTESGQKITKKFVTWDDYQYHYMIKDNGTITTSSFINLYKYDITNYTHLTFKVYDNPKYSPYLIEDANGNVILLGNKKAEGDPSWSSFDIDTPIGAKYLYLNNQAKDERYAQEDFLVVEKIVIPEHYVVPKNALATDLDNLIDDSYRKTLFAYHKPSICGSTWVFGEGDHNSSTIMNIESDTWIENGGKWNETTHYEAYACVSAYLSKIDFTDKKNPTYMSKLSICPTGSNATDLPSDMSAFKDSGANFCTRNCAITDNYIYVAIRYSKGVHRDGTLLYGGVCIIDKSTFTVVKTLWLKDIISRVTVKGNLLAVGEQMYGLAFYDISNPTNPTLIKEFVYDTSTGTNGHESQAGYFIDVDDKTYFINMGFGMGFTIYDVTDTSNIQQITVCGCFSMMYKRTGEDIYVHTYEAVIHYPYMYCTMAYNKKDELWSDNAKRTGVFTMDLSDITNPVLIDMCSMDVGDLREFNSIGDTKPTVIKEPVKNILITNYEYGVPMFKIADDGKSVKYLGKYSEDETTRTYAICSTEYGTLVGNNGIVNRLVGI